jgi:hypothetical protein
MSQPKVRATVHRFGIGVKPSGPRGAGGDFHVDAEGGGVLDEVLAVASIDPDRVDGGVVGSDLVEQAGAGDGVLDAAAVTSTASRRPSVSVTMLRFVPTIFLAGPCPSSWRGHWWRS